MNNFIRSSLKKLRSQDFLNPELDLRILLNNSKKINKEIFINNVNENEINLKKFNKLLQRRLKHEPISKILNKKNFWKYQFFVDCNVLDPRPETELIIEESLSFILDKSKKINILDIGTGSGCLSISLAKEFLNSNVLAIDISRKAIEVAKKNILYFHCEDQVTTKVQDFTKINRTFDLIVSNPPYLSENEYFKIDRNIKKFEPKTALLGGKDGLNFYREFAKILPKIMKKKSLLIIEIGANQFPECMKIFSNSGLKFIKKTKDLQKKDRILIFSRV